MASVDEGDVAAEWGKEKDRYSRVDLYLSDC